VSAMRRRAIPTVTAAALALAAAAAVAPAATAPKTAVATDAKGDVRSTLDLTRLSVARGDDGRLRASITLAAAWDGKDLLAASGPPGSICLKAWTATAPPDTTPDHLICATAQDDGTLRGSILEQRANKLPARTGSADVSRPSERTVTLRFSPAALGRSATLYLAAEATRPGCTRGSCVDLAPDAPKTLKLRVS